MSISSDFLSSDPADAVALVADAAAGYCLAHSTHGL